MAEKETYTSMLVGVAIFVGGMIAVVLLLKYLNAQSLTAHPITPQPIPQPIPSSAPQSVIVRENVPTNEFFTHTETITSFITMLDERSQVNLPWTSFDIVNNGPNAVFFSVNNYEEMKSSIQPGQTVTVDLRQPHAIKKVYLKCDPGETANVGFYILR